MRVFVLCVDALEYNFVRDRPYSNLKQKRFFKVHIPRECMTIFDSGRVGPFTPVIWKAIFTGKIEQMGPEPKPEKMQWRSGTLNWLKSKEFVNRFYVSLLRRGILSAGFPERLGFKRKDLLKDEDTFISESSRPIIIHNPLKVDVEWAAKGLQSAFKPSEIIQSRVEVFQKERLETLVKLKHDWDLFLVYTKLLDIVGHLFWQKDSIIEKYYRMVDNFAGEIQNNLPHEAFMVTISDHGMEPLTGTEHKGGEHSHHAYASFSDEIDVPQPLKITDFHSIISSLLQQRKDEELIMKRLKELGYI